MSTSDNPPSPKRISVIDKDGVRGWIDELRPLASIHGTSLLAVRTDDGRAFSVQRGWLVGPTHGRYALNVSFAELAASQSAAVPARGSARADGTSDTVASNESPLVVPVLAEKLVVSKRPVITGRLRLTKRVRSREEAINETVKVERADVERVPINRVVDTAPGIRYEGETMVISVVEEVIVVEKRLMLREELRITTRHLERRIDERVRVRTEEVTVERFDSQGRKRRADRA